MNFDTSVKVELIHPQAQLPRLAHDSDACFDLISPQACSIEPGQTAIIPLGFRLELELGWEAQVRGRSGLASRGRVVHAGTIDHLYRQEVKCIVYNLGQDSWEVQVGDRIAQMKISRVWKVQIIESPVLDSSRGGLGSTGR